MGWRPSIEIECINFDFKKISYVLLALEAAAVLLVFFGSF